MELLRQAERFAEQGRVEEAVECYKSCIASEEKVSADIYYEAGYLSLTICMEEFQQSRYEEGLDFLTTAYNMGCKNKEEVYRLLFEVACSPNLENLRENYQKNAMESCETVGEFITDFEKLPFVLFALSPDRFMLYDKEKDVFAKETDVNLKYWPHVAFMMNWATAQKWVETIGARLINERKAQTLFCHVSAALEKNLPGKRLLAEIEEFHTLMPFSEKYEWMMGCYYHLRKEYRQAMVYIEQGMKKRPLHMELRALAARVYFQLEAYDKAAANFLCAAVKGEAKAFFEGPYTFDSDTVEIIKACIELAGKKSLELQCKVLTEMGFALRHARDCIMGPEFYLDESGQLKFRHVYFLGKIIEKAAPDARYFCGVYAEYTRLNTCAAQADIELQSGNMVFAHRRTYDMIEIERIAQNFSYKEMECPCLIPFMPTDFSQCIEVAYKGKKYDDVFGKLECNFLRIAAPVEFSSKKEFVVGRPILLRHHPKRKKLILNILVDALSFAKIKENDFALMQNTYKFFQKGVIFARNYTPAEWTMPSNTSIQTGVYQDRTQIFHGRAFVCLDEQHETIAQRMREEGYYCMLFAGLLSQRLCNVYRGFHRMIGAESINADTLMANAIKYMQAMRETDLFMHMHLMDAHIHGRPVSLEQKVNLDLEDFFGLSLSDTKSVWSKSTIENLRHYEEKVKQIDRVLGSLFDFLEKQYQEEEYVIVLHSDHGMSLVGEETLLFKKGLSNATFMVRGGNVPLSGMVKEEVTNTMDLYATLAHLCGYKIADGLDCRLPKVFGGAGREYSISNSLYPGQTYKLCIHTLQHVFFLETKGKVTLDGRVNMNAFTYQIFTGDEENVPVQDVRLANYFIKIALEHTARIHDFSA